MGRSLAGLMNGGTVSGNTTPECLPLSFEVNRGFVAAFLRGSGRELDLRNPSSGVPLLVSPDLDVSIPTPDMRALSVREGRMSTLCCWKEFGGRRRCPFMPLMPLESEGDVSTGVSIPSVGRSSPSCVSFGAIRSCSMAFISSFRPR